MSDDLVRGLRVARGEDPLAPGEVGWDPGSESDVAAIVRGIMQDEEGRGELRRLLGQELCAPVHLFSNAGVVREVTARITRGELEVRRQQSTRALHIPRVG